MLQVNTIIGENISGREKKVHISEKGGREPEHCYNESSHNDWAM